MSIVQKRCLLQRRRVPSLLLQPLVENAVKHGVATLQKEGSIRVEVLRQGNDLVIRISDNGKGFAPGQETPGYGLKTNEGQDPAAE